jgi:hypothetical protein
MSGMHGAAGQALSYEQALVSASPPSDTGPLFVELLLLYFGLARSRPAPAGWRRCRTGCGEPAARRRSSVGTATPLPSSTIPGTGRSTLFGTFDGQDVGRRARHGRARRASTAGGFE